MKTSDDFTRELLNGTNLMAGGLTLKSYADELVKFEDNVCRLTAGEDYWEGMRFDDATYLMGMNSRKKNLRSNDDIHNGILALKRMQKEMSITMSGVKAESRIFETLQYLSRHNAKIFANVYLSNGQEETEVDDIVLTDAGIVVLEVKKTSSDVTISPEGRLVKAGSECYDKIPLGENMIRKRRLLKEALEKAINEKDLDIPVVIDSRIVFTTPGDKFIRVNDQYHKERYCFRSNLNPILEAYDGGCHYNDSQIEQLSEMLSSMKTNTKVFGEGMNCEDTVHKIAKALEVLQMDKEADPEPEAIDNIVEFKEVQQRSKGNKFLSALHAAAEAFKCELKGA